MNVEKVLHMNMENVNKSSLENDQGQDWSFHWDILLASEKSYIKSNHNFYLVANDDTRHCKP